MFSRAPGLAAMVVAALVGAGALASICLRAESGGAPEEAQAQLDNSTAVVGWSGPEGALVGSVSSDTTGARMSAYSADGSLVWSASGAIDVIEAGFPQAVVVKQVPDAGSSTSSNVLFRVGDGGRETEVARSQGSIRPLRATPSEIVYVEDKADERTGLITCTVVTVDDEGTVTTPVSGGGYSLGVGISRDGDALVLVTVRDASNLLSWLKRSTEGTWQMVAQEETEAYYVALAPDGASAVLGLEPPELVSFGQSRGRALPGEAVSQAWFSGSRVLLLLLSDQPGGQSTSVALLEADSGKLLWRHEFSGERRVCTNGAMSSVAYLNDAKNAASIVDVATGTERVLKLAPAEDMGFLEDDKLIVALEDGTVEIVITDGNQ